MAKEKETKKKKNPFIKTLSVVNFKLDPETQRRVDRLLGRLQRKKNDGSTNQQSG